MDWRHKFGRAFQALRLEDPTKQREKTKEGWYGALSRGGGGSSHCGSTVNDTRLVSMRMWVQSLALLSGLRIWRCRERGVGCKHGLDLESKALDFFLGTSLKDEVLKLMPMFKVLVAIGDDNEPVGLGVNCSKEVATAICGAIVLAKLSIVPMQQGSWGNKTGKPHTVPHKVTGSYGSWLVRLIPAPWGSGMVSAPVPKKLLMMVGTDDCYTSARGCTATLVLCVHLFNKY
uniref:Small ribosomal subunit protein uS5 n=1 Tax=Sus scrofa TaxID=9823 RepID=A0A8D1G4T5_PIG